MRNLRVRETWACIRFLLQHQPQPQGRQHVLQSTSRLIEAGDPAGFAKHGIMRIPHRFGHNRDIRIARDDLFHPIHDYEQLPNRLTLLKRAPVYKCEVEYERHF